MWVPYYPQSSTEKGLRQGYCIFIEFMEIVQVLNFETLEVELFCSWLLGGRLMTISAYLLKHKKSQKNTTTQTNTRYMQITFLVYREPSLVKLLTITFCAFSRVGKKLRPHLFPHYWLLCIGEHFLRKLYFLGSSPYPSHPGRKCRNKKWEKALFWGVHPPLGE